MTDPENPLLSITLDPDNYASASSTASYDTPPVPRTFQTPAAFTNIKTSYTAKQDNGNLYAGLLRAVPELQDSAAAVPSTTDKRRKLEKREQLLLGYVVGELYYDGEFERVVELCRRVRERFGDGDGDGRFGKRVESWGAVSYTHLTLPTKRIE